MKPICTCLCHEEGLMVLHMFACCNMSGVSYMRNGLVDETKFKTALKELETSIQQENGGFSNDQ